LRGVDDFDVLPPDLSITWHENIEEVARWSQFMAIPNLSRYFKALSDITPTMIKTVIDYKPKKLKSLLSYYYLLPQWAREHPIIKSVVQNIEHTKPHQTYREKQLMINMAMTLLMPMDAGIIIYKLRIGEFID
jgi:hypothetical protein